MTPEGRVKEGIKKQLHRRAIVPASQVAKLIAAGAGFEGWYYMPPQGAFSVHGIPDFVICYRGKFLAIEAKAPGGKATDNQMTQMAGIEGGGGKAWIVSDPAQIDSIPEFNELEAA